MSKRLVVPVLVIIIIMGAVALMRARVDYYTEITEYTSKPVAFTEIGWYREDLTGWESSVEEQVEFIEFYFNATAELVVEFETWSFLFDQDIFVPFKSMGLLQIGETTSAALKAWINR